MTNETSVFGPVLLVIAAGAVFSVQNLLLAAMVARGVGQFTVLALNAGVAIFLLVALNAAFYGASALTIMARTWQWWYLIPGLMGTFVVFALVFGYTKAGAALPAVALITGQVTTAFLLDAGGISARPVKLTLLSWVGLAMFLGGAALIFLSRE